MQSIKLKLQDLKNYLHLTDKHLKGAGVGFGVLLAGALIYSFFPKSSTPKTTPATQQEQPTFGQIYTSAINAVTETLAKYNGISNEVIKQIIKSQYKLAEHQYIELVLKLRNDRRKVINQKSEYSKLILSIDSQIQNLMDKHLNAILAHFSIDKTYWIQAVELWTTQSEQNKQQWEVLLSEMQQEQLMSLRKSDKQPLKLKKLLQIIDYKTSCLKTYEPSTFQLQSSEAEQQPDLNAKYTLIDNYISDLVFKKFGVEEQDIIYSVQKLQQKDKQTYESHEDEFTDLMRTQIFGNQLEENQQDQWEDEEHDQAQKGDEQADQ